MGGRARQVRGGEPRAFGFRELSRRVTLAGEERRDRLDVEVARLSQRAQNFGARTWLPHDPGGRAFLAQRVVDQARYRRAVARAGEAVRKPPILYRVGCGPTTGIDIRQNFNCSCGAGGGDHGEGSPLAKWSLRSAGQASNRLAAPVTASSVYIEQDASARIRRQRRHEILVDADGPAI